MTTASGAALWLSIDNLLSAVVFAALALTVVLASIGLLCWILSDEGRSDRLARLLLIWNQRR
ncbi:hypothetical protein JIG36_31235 [Actinoplanes sp. LDG1-06]|uniref:ATP synthase F0 subunit 8 n=1 Tax=Paractinoplanes ovalisporus TaxID=2810368 RepID=A0ABS2AJG1_9ACTN|nr:hypothetical protein [Actinoplanes ovalisporus]MBM2619997.1 hypothetical protein [Actinoplanes ovalisporus]